MGVPFCRDCQHFLPMVEVCARSKPGGSPDIVTGELPRFLRIASGERKSGFFRDACGPQAKYFEARPPRPALPQQGSVEKKA